MKNQAHFRSGAIIATVHTLRGLHIAPALSRKTDWFELRLDLLPFPLPLAALRRLAALRTPLLCTARDPGEGGRPGLNAAARLKRLLAALPVADAIDVELANATVMARAIHAAHTRRKAVVISFHDFHGTPSSKRLSDILRRMAGSGAQAAKIATYTANPGDIARLLALLNNPPLPVAVMGMGPFGTLSRPVAAACGSILNYGYIDKPQVDGQWPPPALQHAVNILVGTGCPPLPVG